MRDIEWVNKRGGRKEWNYVDGWAEGGHENRRHAEDRDEWKEKENRKINMNRKE